MKKKPFLGNTKTLDLTHEELRVERFPQVLLERLDEIRKAVVKTWRATL